MRNAAGQQSDHLHATSPFQSRREFRPVTLKKFAFDGISDRVSGKPHD